MYPISTVPAKVYGLPKTHKVGTTLRPMVSRRGSITYRVAKVLAGIICFLVGQSPLHLKHTQLFVEHIMQVKLEPGKTIASFDVKALFTSVQVDPYIHIVQQKLSQDTTCPQWTNMSILQIITLLEFYLKHTYFH